MKKKNYEKPSMKVLKLMQQSAMLAGSNDAKSSISSDLLEQYVEGTDPLNFQ